MQFQSLIGIWFCLTCLEMMVFLMQTTPYAWQKVFWFWRKLFKISHKFYSTSIVQNTIEKNNIKSKINELARNDVVVNSWTKNNCESMNHVLKQAVDWKSKSLADFVEIAQTLVHGQNLSLKLHWFKLASFVWPTLIFNFWDQKQNVCLFLEFKDITCLRNSGCTKMAMLIQ